MPAQYVFDAAILIGYGYILLIVWSILKPQRRIWPPGQINWKIYLSWSVFYLVAGADIALMVLDWNTWTIPPAIRFAIGPLLIALGLGLICWGIRTLGMKNTHGIRDRFIVAGPYRFTRNPQYLGDIIMLSGIILIVNSVQVAVITLLIILSFALMPIAEESWLEEQYGEAFRHYKTQAPRFL